jgi:organic radical activating enzyme
MLPIQIKNVSGDQYFQINWMLHDKCTYACSYCPPSNHAGTDNWLNLEKVISTCDNIKNQVSPAKKVQILFSGGEPTVWKNFANLADHLYKENWSLNIITNLSRSEDWWEELDVQWNQVSASLHPEFSDIESFIKKCHIIHSKSKSLSIRVMLHPDQILFKKALSWAYKIKKECPYVFIEWIPIIYEFGGAVIQLSPYTTSQIELMSKLRPLRPGAAITKKIEISNQKSVIWESGLEEKLNAQFLVKNNLNIFNNWTCNAGIDGVFIDSKGYIFRGTCLQGDSLGNIQDGFVTLPSESIICERKVCECITDIYYSKIKN